MKLTNVGFDGFFLQSVNYKLHQKSDRGRLNLSISDPEISVHKAETENSHRILMKFDLEMLGFPGDVDPESEGAETAFEATMALETYFLDVNEECMQEYEIIEDIWFFENFNQIAFKLAVENFFKDTEIENITLPWTVRLNNEKTN